MRGKAMSLAPIMSGSMKLPKALQTGITNKKIIVVPCMVNSWLYWEAVKRSLLGSASCVLISNAINPPMRKKAMVVHR
jgi:hypothetical protein